MKTFRKKLLRKALSKAQSAMEYLMTYGWAILIVAVVLGALYSLGVFNGAAFLGTSCIAASGFYCNNPILSTGGVLTVTIGQATGTTFKNAYLYFVPSGTSFSTSDPSISIGTLNSGQQVTVSIPLRAGSPYPAAYTLGTPISGYLYLQFTDIYGTNEVNNIATVLTKVTATSSGGATTPTSTPTTIQYIYCVGTSVASQYNYVYYAPVSSTGIGTWQATTRYPVRMYNAGCSIYNGYIYCVGGSRSYAVYYAPVSSTGIGTWQATTRYPVGMYGAGCSIYNGYIYCVGAGGPSHTQVYYAPVSSTGIGTWQATTSYPVKMNFAGCSIYNSYIYCVGSYTSPYAVYYAPVSSTGIGTWQATTSYPVEMYDAGCSIYNGYIYCVGSIASPYAVYYAPVSSTGIGTWQATTRYPVGMYGAGCSIYNGYIYCVGTGGASPYAVYYAPVSSMGIGTWQATTRYPVGMRDAYCEIPGSGGGFLGGGGPN